MTPNLKKIGVVFSLPTDREKIYEVVCSLKTIFEYKLRVKNLKAL